MSDSSSRGGVLLRLAGGFLLLVPWLPIRSLFGARPGDGGLVAPSTWALGTAIVVAAGWLAARASEAGPGREAGRKVRELVGRFRARVARTGSVGAVALLALAGALVGVSVFLYGGKPLFTDSVLQLFQAKIFASGAVTAPRPPGDAFFVTTNALVGPEGWYSQYPPGHPALLAPGVLSGVPWLAPILLSVGAAASLFAFAREAYDLSTARLTAVLALLCPFLWLLGAGFTSHVPTLFFASFLLLALARAEAGDGLGWPAAAGLALGGAFLCRPLTGLALGAGTLPILPSLAGSDERGGPGGASRWVRPATVLGGAGAVGLLYLAYNAATTGHPLRPGYLELWGAAHGLGFHATPWGGVHTPLDGLANALTDLSLLNLHLFEWPVPALAPVGLALAAGWLRDRWDGRLVLLFLAVPAAYFFYWHRDAVLGPRFLYAGLAPLLPLTARALRAGWRELEGRRWRPLPGVSAVDAGRWAAAAVTLCVAYALAQGVPRRASVHASGTEGFRVDLAGDARAAGIERALVFVPVSWGNRLIADLRGLGTPAGLVERAYRSTDHCDLDRLVRRARAGGWPPERVGSGLDSLRAATGAVVRTDRLNGDPSLRLRRDRSSLPTRCREEIEYDRRGYTNYVPHLTVNDPGLAGPLVVARDLRDRNEELWRAFPDRSAYLYRDGRFRRLR